MKIADGWRFSSADFSLQTGLGDEESMGFVVLVRAPDEKARWHQTTKEITEGDNEPPLFVVGSALTLEDAINDANLLAAKAKPIKSYDNG